MALYSTFKIFFWKQISHCRNCSSKNAVTAMQPKFLWNEKREIAKRTKENNLKPDGKRASFRDTAVLGLSKLGRIVLYSGEFSQYLKEKALQQRLLSQQFIPARAELLGFDLAAAHFILNRGGRVKFWGRKEWIDRDNQVPIPCIYVPGYYIEGINASGTDLYYEGLQNLKNLKKMKWLSLKGLVNLNDFALDYLSGEFSSHLEYLDLTDCTEITHHGLTSLYRFKCLKYVNVSGLDHTPEFKLTCIMLQDILPDLVFGGIHFSDDELIEHKVNEENSGSKSQITGEPDTKQLK